jgi:tRNA C32,U32 (ribose-2'-O)-methylase TrmJ
VDTDWVAVRPQEYDGGKTHYRRRRVMGHLRALFSRAGINTQEVKSLHGLVKKITAAANQARASADEQQP